MIFHEKWFYLLEEEFKIFSKIKVDLCSINDISLAKSNFQNNKINHIKDLIPKQHISHGMIE